RGHGGRVQIGPHGDSTHDALAEHPSRDDRCHQGQITSAWDRAQDRKECDDTDGQYQKGQCSITELHGGVEGGVPGIGRYEALGGTSGPLGTAQPGGGDTHHGAGHGDSGVDDDVAQRPGTQGPWGRGPDGACQEKQDDHTGRGESDLPAPEGDTENDDIVQVRRHRGKGARGRRRGRRNRHTTDCSTWVGRVRRDPTTVVTCTDVFSTYGGAALWGRPWSGGPPRPLRPLPSSGNAADRPWAAGRFCELHLRRRRFVSSAGPVLRGCSSSSLRAEVRVEPALAVITHTTASHCHTVSDSPSRTRPTRAAAAGCKLINTPKTRGGMRRRAFSSKV